MFVFNTSSWHYQTVKYVFGDSFFAKKELDVDATIKKLEFKPRKALAYSEIKDKIDVTDTDDFIYKQIPKVINFCPYCRALAMAVPLLPFAFIAKKIIPRRKKKPFDIKKSRRNIRIAKIVVVIMIGTFGVHQLIVGNYGLAAFHFSIATFNIWGYKGIGKLARWYEKRQDKKENKNKEKQIPVPKNPSLLWAYLHTNHKKICPAVAFVDENDTEVRI